jgi:1,4-dihydroxy-6-naphthoate synthase
VGTSVGRRYGPRLVAREAVPLAALKGKRIALPGPKTTAALMSRGLFPPFEPVHMDFTDIMDAVQSGDVDAGVLIHEGQLTYAEEGLVLLADLGVLFAEKHDGLPLPLGVNCIRRDLAPEIKKSVAEAYRKSVEIAMEQRDKAVTYSLEYGRGLSQALADEFVGMYVNEDSLQFNDELRAAVKIIQEEYYQAPA